MTETKDSAATIALLDGKLRVHDDTVWGGVAKAASAQNQNIIRFVGGILNHPDQTERLRNTVYDLIDPALFAGFIATSSNQLAGYIEPEALAAFLSRLDPLPGVNCGISLRDRIPHIEVNIAGHIQQMLNHLIEDHGYQRIAHIHGPVTAAWSQERFNQYQAALKTHELPFDPALVAYGDITLESGYQAMQTLLADPAVEFDAVFSANDSMAVGAIQALQAHGLSVPQDMAVVGIDNNEYAQIANPPLTTIGQSFHEQGILAVQTLQHLLNGDTVPHAILQEPTNLIIRRSCGCFPARVIDEQESPPTPANPHGERSALLADLTAALPTIAPTMLTGLVDSLLAETPATPFLELLDEHLAQAISDHELLTDWQSHLTTMRQIVGMHRPDQEALWHQARILVADAAVRAQALRSSVIERRRELLWEIAQHLMAASDMESLSSRLAHELPRLGITYFNIASYQPESDQARVVAAANTEGTCIGWQDDQVFRAQDLTPIALGRPTTPYNLTVEALHFQDEALGFAVFEADPHLAPIYEALRLYLSSAIKNVVLFETVQRHATHLEAQVAARTQQLETEVAERQRAEAALLDSQNMLEAVLDSIPIRVFWKDRNSVLIGANRASWQEGGLDSANDLIGKTDYDLVQDEMAAQYQSDDRKVMQTGKPMLNYEEMHITKAGERIWLNTNKVPLRNHQNEIIGVLVMLQDISPLKKIQHELQLERNLLRTIVEYAPMEIYAKDVDSKFTLANALTRQQLGVTDEAELLGKTDADLPVFAEHQALAASLLVEEQHIIRTGEVILNRETRPVKWPVAAGNMRWLLVNKVPLLAQDGEIAGLVGINIDITERKQIEAALQQSEAKFAQAFQAAPVAINISRASDGRFIEVNDGFTRMFGYARDEALGRTSKDLNLHTDNQNRTDILHKLREDGQIYNAELLGRRKSGQVLTCLISMQTIELNGETCIVTITHDITEQRAAEAALRESEERYRQIIEAAPMAINVYVVTEANARIVYANAMSVKLLGAKSRDQVIGLDPTRLILNQSEAYLDERLEALQAGETIPTGHYIVQRLDGRQITIEVGSIPYSYDGQPAVLSILQDVTERRAAESALRASEERYRQIVEAAPMATTIYLIDNSMSHFVYVNAAAVRLFGGQDAEQFVGMNPLDLIASDDRHIGRERMQRLHDGQAPGTAQYTLHRLDGRDVEVEIGSIPYVFEGQPAVLSILQDVTERASAEIALRQSEEKFARAFRAVPDSVTISTEAEGRLIELNEGFTRLFGYTRAEALGKTTLELNLYENTFDRDLVVEIMRQDGRVSDLELRGQHKSGEIRVCLLSAESIIVGAEPCWVTIVHDITDQRAAEDALIASEERYRLVSELISDYAFAYQVLPDGQAVHEWTTVDAYQRLTGYMVDKPEPVVTFFHPDDQERAYRDIYQSLAGQATGGEYRFITKDGDVRWIRLSRQVQWDEKHQRVTRLYGVAQDITHHKRYEAERERLITELEHHNLEMERFLYAVSHDLRSPLITMKGFLSYLEEDLTSENILRVRTDLGYIKTATDQMEHLLDDLLELSRIGRIESKAVVVPLAEVIETATRLVAGAVAKRGVTISIGADLPDVLGNRARLLEVFQNLLENAIKYMGDQTDPRIEVGAQVEDDLVRCFVRDNGIGIDAAYHDKIFGLFEQLEPHSDGTGIGLALVQRIIEAHDGKIHVESKGEGHGSTFVFTLPRA